MGGSKVGLTDSEGGQQVPLRELRPSLSADFRPQIKNLRKFRKNYTDVCIPRYKVKDY
jgi:hypothetical protein